MFFKPDPPKAPAMPETFSPEPDPEEAVYEPADSYLLPDGFDDFDLLGGDNVEALKDEIEALKEALEEAQAAIERHGLEIIRLTGVISDGVTTQARLAASHWLSQLRAWARAVKEALS